MRIFTSLCLLLLTLGLQAQRSYVDASVSYAFGIQPNLDSRFVSSKFSFAPLVGRFVLRKDQTGANLASGPQLQLTGGYDFPTNFGLCVDLGWLPNISQSWTAEENSGDRIAEEAISGQLLDMALLLRFRLGNGLAIPYMAMGPSFGLPFFQRQFSIRENGAELLEERWEYSNNVAFGFRAKAGLRVHLRNYAEFFIEGQWESMAFYPKGEYLRLYEENNQDLLATRSVAQANILYRAEFNEEYVLGPDGERIRVLNQNEPFLTERISLPLHRMHLRLGYRRFLNR